MGAFILKINSMDYSVFIRSYKGDIEWLKYCLKSIHKYLKGWSEIVVVVPESQKSYFDQLNLTAEKLYICPDYQNDYLGQQITKHFAFDYCQSENILFVDSDCVFVKETTIEDFIKDGKPCILKTPYESIPEVKFWQDITSRALGFTPEFECMRRLPMMYLKETLKNVVSHTQKFLDQPLQSYIKEQPNREYSEFNVIGAYTEKFESDKYYFLDTTKEAFPEQVIVQNWSWGGITPEIRIQLEEITK